MNASSNVQQNSASQVDDTGLARSNTAVAGDTQAHQANQASLLQALADDAAAKPDSSQAIITAAASMQQSDILPGTGVHLRDEQPQEGIRAAETASSEPALGLQQQDSDPATGCRVYQPFSRPDEADSTFERFQGLNGAMAGSMIPPLQGPDEAGISDQSYSELNTNGDRYATYRQMGEGYYYIPAAAPEQPAGQQRPSLPRLTIKPTSGPYMTPTGDHRIYPIDTRYYDPERADFTSDQDFTHVLGSPVNIQKWQEETTAKREDEFDDYAYENLGEDFEATPWVPPSVARAKAYRELSIFKGGKARMLDNVDLSELGLGVDLTFRFIRLLVLSFASFFIFYIPALIIFFTGKSIPKGQQDFLGLYAVTIGNITRTQTVSKYMGAVVAFDLLVCLAFTYVTLMWHRIISNAKMSQTSVFAKEYAVWVSNLPRDIEKADIIDFFSMLYPLDKKDWKGRPPPAGVDLKPIYEAGNTGDDRYIGKWVAEVAVARKMGKKIRVFLSNAEKTRELKRLRARVKMYSQDTPLLKGKGANERRRNKYLEEHDNLGADIEDIADALNSSSRDAEHDYDCHGAFVVFEYPFSRDRCLRDYATWKLQYICGFPKALKFKGRRLFVTPAPDPEDVRWENLEVTASERFCRRNAVNCVTFIVLLVSFTVIAFLTQAKDHQVSTPPDMSLCSTELPALYFGSIAAAANAKEQPGGLQWLEGNSSADNQCRRKFPGSIYAVYTTNASAMLPALPYDISACSKPNYCPDPKKLAQCPCLVAGGKSTCDTLPCSPGDSKCTFPRSTIAACFCNQNSSTDTFASSFKNGNNFCRELVGLLVLGTFLQLFITISTLGINFLLAMFLSMVSYYEYNASADVEAMLLISKAFVSQFLNTAVVLLIVRGSLKSGTGLAKVIHKIYILNGDYADFSRGWYGAVGTQLSLTALIGAISPHMYPFMMYLVIYPFMRFKARYLGSKANPSIVMQQDLNELYVGPRFDIVQRSASLLAVIFSTLIYSAGMPIMILFGLLAFVLIYIVDRFLLLRFYQRPPQRDQRIARHVCSYLPYALCLHLSFTIWMFGNDYLGMDTVGDTVVSLPKTAGISDMILSKIRRKQCFPFFLFWIVVLAFIFVRDVLPTYYATRLIGKIKESLGSLWASKNDDKKQQNWGNGYTKTYELPIAGNKKLTEDQTWKAFTADDGLSVLRRLKSPAERKAAREKGVDAAGTAACRKTWEVVKENGLCSYSLSRNPKYRDTVLTFLTEFSDLGNEPEGAQGVGYNKGMSKKKRWSM